MANQKILSDKMGFPFVIPDAKCFWDSALNTISIQSDLLNH